MQGKHKFFLEKVSSKAFRYVTFSADVTRLDDYLSDVEYALRKAKYKGRVLFDLLLANGVSSHRFFVAEFDGSAFQSDSFSATDSRELDEIVRERCRHFYASHSELLEYSVLTKAQRFLVRRKAI